MESRGFRVDHIEIVKKIEIQWRKCSTSEEEWVEGRMFQHFGEVVRKMMEGTQQAIYKGTVPVTRWMMYKWEEEKIEAWERAELASKWKKGNETDGLRSFGWECS